MNKKYKMLAVDMDGTLLDRNKIIPDENIEALFKAQMNGLKVVFSTGRVIESAYSYAAAIDMHAEFVGSNGAAIAYENYEEKLYIDNDEVFKYAYLCQELDLDYNIITEHHNYYYRNLNFYNAYYSDNKMVKNSVILSKSIFHHIDEIKDILENEKIIKMDIYETGENRLSKIWNKLDHIKFCVLRPEYDYIEIMDISATKGIGVNKIANHYNIKMEEIITIGDGGNDISMFEKSGLSIAMGNAISSVKEFANMTTDTNENAGVAKALKLLKVI
ncbi:MAG: HAD family phosphatase [Eubacteriaceae bacterium]|nr:HAD family phosphatase [Eubacteriaceae bacterium]